MAAFYNEIDPYAAQWLRNLITAGHIAHGVVDTRSIADISPADVAGFTQVHFFAGIGGWSLAARLAGWPDDRPLWTGSCPCQPFSVAGAGAGQADARHLWPEFHRLIAACRPDVVMGEQVAAAVGKSWLDGVHSDLESIGYTCGAAVVPACAVDAPHRRDRLWFVANDGAGRRLGPLGRQGEQPRRAETFGAGDSDCLANSHEQGLAQREGHTGISREGRGEREGQDATHVHSALAPSGPLANTALIDDGRRAPEPLERPELESRIGSVQGYLVNAPSISQREPHDQGDALATGGEARGLPRRASPWDSVADAERVYEDGTGYGASDVRGKFARATSLQRREGFWSDSTLAIGADGKARRVKPGVRLLAHGIPARVGKLRALGNAIVPQVAAEIIGAYMDAADA